MSQQDLERGDQEVMGIVNDHAHPDTAAAAEEITEQLLQPEEPESDCDNTCYDEEPELVQMWNRKLKIRETISTGVCVAVCLLVAVLLVVANFLPDILIWIVNGGVLCCGIVAAVKLDRLISRRKSRW